MGLLPPDADERLHRLHAYWNGLRPAPDLLPGRQHFDPVDIPALLPYLWLLDVSRDPLRFRYRLSGTELVKAMGADFNGKYLDEIRGDFANTTTGLQHAEVVRTGAPAFREGWPTLHQGMEFRWMQRLVLPLARDGKTVDIVLGIGVYDDQTKRINRPPAS